MKFIKYTAIGAILAAGMAHAEVEPTDPNAKMRAELMEGVGGAMKILGGMAKGEVAYEATAAEAAKAKLVEASAGIETAFATEGAADPASEAKPVIWTSWDDFAKKAGALHTAATGADVSSVEAITTSMGTLGGACKDCHTTYRVMKE
ncbi:MAG: cytochrome c [Paracoccaceae bacterium]